MYRLFVHVEETHGLSARAEDRIVQVEQIIKQAEKENLNITAIL
jgi:predicted small metal-binding protein